jgi:lipopolysaccharide/colanic/teichoic acid biosynthesis glycosyltransferase
MLKGHVLRCKRYDFICQRFVLYRFKYNGIYNVCCIFLLQCLCSCVDDTGEYIFKRNSSLVTLQLNLLSLSVL